MGDYTPFSYFEESRSGVGLHRKGSGRSLLGGWRTIGRERLRAERVESSDRYERRRERERVGCGLGMQGEAKRRGDASVPKPSISVHLKSRRRSFVLAYREDVHM